VRPLPGWVRPLVLAVFAVAFTLLSLGNYRQSSATWDEPIHLTDGYASLEGDYRVDPEHPPFLRMWAALPLLATHPVVFDPHTIDQSGPTAWALQGVFAYAHDFLYRDNDADHLLYRARFMIVLLGVLLGTLVFSWAFEWFGLRTAIVALALFLVEPNLAAHSVLVTTDLGVTCFIFGAIYFLWRVTKRLSWGNLTGAAAFTALAAVSKFSAAILAPIAATLLVASVFRLRSIRLRSAVLVGAVLTLSAIVAIWAVYRFRYLPSTSPAWTYALDAEPTVRSRVPSMAAMAGWLDAHRLLPNVYVEGFVLGQAKASARSAFLNGNYSTTGWWYYFPLAFLMKTPVALLFAAALGAMAWLRQWRRVGPGHELFVVAPIAIYMAWAMTANINIGLRHILPIYPFIILMGAAGLHTSASRGVRPLVTSVLVVALVEFATIYPRPLTFFNLLAGGVNHGAEHLVDSNLDWGQDLKALKRWMDERGVSSINMAYFGSADPSYYGIDCIYLPGSPLFVPPDRVSAPVLPGYVAVSETLLSGVYSDPRQRAFYAPFAHLAPIASIGHTINVYWVDQRWW
jgi:hypothetical protein